MDVLSIFIAIIGIAIGLGGVYAYFRKGTGEGVITLQAEEIKTLTGIKSRLETDNATLTQALKGKNEQIDDLKRQNDNLAALSQGSPKLIELTQAINSQTSEIKNLVKQVGRIASASRRTKNN